ncbi:hypothetical protein [Caballeronia sp. ATUFL_F1_KS39]|uniref:HNH endonuclease n=1 Tax=Caballeronia sp. ATUFL_F1_KS39 TaxID=2921766 RepID=UPI002027BD83|nr:hypothetical protein [Caballeronia sp. ATUFL_F1_KS39]
MTDYSEKLRDPRWQKARLEIMERDGWRCTNCGATRSTLSVHHRRYVKGLQPWEYHESSLVTLCGCCHYCLHQDGGLSTVELFERVMLEHGADPRHIFTILAAVCATCGQDRLESPQWDRIVRRFFDVLIEEQGLDDLRFPNRREAETWIDDRSRKWFGPAQR